VLIGQQALYNHNYKKHFVGKRKRAAIHDMDCSPPDFTINNTVDIGACETSYANEVVDNSPSGHSNPHVLMKYALPDLPSVDCYSSVKNQLYFQQNHVEKGPSLLVTRSQGFAMNCGPKIDELEVEVHFQMASLLCGLTRGQRDEMASLLTMCISITQMHEKQSLTIPTVLPCSSQLMWSLYMKGKSAILPNLPRPSIRMIDEHAYVSLYDCVADLLGHGLDVQHISEIDPLDATVIDVSKCHLRQQIYARGSQLHGSKPFLCLYIMELSDGFEPSTSSNANRGSCWINTVTISPMNRDLHSLTNTYPIAMARANVSHECIEKEFLLELKKFQ